MKLPETRATRRIATRRCWASSGVHRSAAKRGAGLSGLGRIGSLPPGGDHRRVLFGHRGDDQHVDGGAHAGMSGRARGLVNG